MTRKRTTADHEILPSTAAQPTSTGTAPAAPPITMFWREVRFNHIE